MIVIVILIVLCIISVISFKLCNLVLLPTKSEHSKRLSENIKSGILTEEECNQLEKEPFEFVGSKGYHLKGEWLYPEKQSDKVMIICHGFGMNLVSSYKYAFLFLKRGWTVLVYDHRHSGESEGRYTTMGYYESRDLKDIVDYIFEKYHGNCKIATLGESMGAATVLLHAAMDQRVNFVIADCSFADLKEQLEYQLKVRYHLPSFPFLPFASLFSKIRAGFYFGEVSPMKEIISHGGMRKTPILFIHGEADDFISPSSSERMAKEKKGDVKLYLCPGAKHACSYCVDPEAYDRTVENFLNEIGED